MEAQQKTTLIEQLNADTMLMSDFTNLIGSVDDESAHHILWVDVGGDVLIEPIMEITPARWATNNPILQFRLETFVCGNGYMGREASRDRKWINRLYVAIIDNWRKGRRGYIDLF